MAMNKALLISLLILSNTCALHTMNRLSTNDTSPIEKPFQITIKKETYARRAQEFITLVTRKLLCNQTHIQAFLSGNQTETTKIMQPIFDAMSKEHMAIHICQITQCFSEHTQLIATTNFVQENLPPTLHKVEPARFKMSYLKIPVDILSSLKTSDDELFKDAISRALEELLQPQHGLHEQGIEKKLLFPKHPSAEDNEAH